MSACTWALAFVGVERLGAALHDVAGAVELRAVAARPERMERVLLAGRRCWPMRVFGITMKAQRTPVKPPFFEKLRNSMAQSRAPSISKMECGIAGSWM